ncbi:hypothetical protein M438DRAFT_312004, partial [Aureobasidium pullulans EXF-150]
TFSLGLAVTSAPLFISHHNLLLQFFAASVLCCASTTFHSSWLEQCQRVPLIPQRVPFSRFTSHHSSHHRIELSLTYRVR